MKSKALAIALLCLSSASAFSEVEPRNGLVNLSATATSEIKNDKMTVILFIENRGADSKEVSALNTEAINKGMEIVKANPDITATTGSRRMVPLYQPNTKSQPVEGVPPIQVWSERAELILSSKDFAGLSDVVAKLSGTLHTAWMNFSVDEETRAKGESAMLEKALTMFRDKAWDVSKLLGKGGYKIVEVNIETSDQNTVRPMAMMMSRGVNESVQVDGGFSSINQTVSGQILLD